MTAALQASIDLLQTEKRRIQDAMTYCLNFDSEGPGKIRKLAHLEGELAGIDEAIGIVESVGRAESVVFS
jgi:hypothetical protein